MTPVPTTATNEPSTTPIIHNFDLSGSGGDGTGQSEMENMIKSPTDLI